MGETWEEDGEQIETDDLYKRREKYNCEVPEEVLVLTAGVDVQDDRLKRKSSAGAWTRKVGASSIKSFTVI